MRAPPRPARPRGASAAAPAAITNHSYWAGRDIARALWLLPNATPSAATGYTLDAYGGIHPLAGVDLRATPYGEPLYVSEGFKVLGGATMAWTRPGVRPGDLEQWQRYLSEPGASYDREIVVPEGSHR